MNRLTYDVARAGSSLDFGTRDCLEEFPVRLELSQRGVRSFGRAECNEGSSQYVAIKTVRLCRSVTSHSPDVMVAPGWIYVCASSLGSHRASFCFSSIMILSVCNFHLIINILLCR
jgi:hypothetical protein